MTDSKKYTSKLQGRKVLIFGGSSGLGYAAAEASVENGMTVVISSSSQKRVDEAIARIIKEYPSAEGRVSGHVCNLSDAKTLEDNIVSILEKVGQVDHIIHSAGDALNSVIKPLDEITVDNAVQSHMVRYFAPMIIGKHAKKYLSSGPEASLTFTSGAITLRPRPNWVIPNGVMAGLNGLVPSLALELAPIRVNCVLPGAVETELWDGMGKDDFAQMKQHIQNSVPTGRLSGPENVAETYLYTMKDYNLTGSIIKTDSGAVLK